MSIHFNTEQMDHELEYEERYTAAWCQVSDFAKEQLRLLNEVLEDGRIDMQAALGCVAMIQTDDLIREVENYLNLAN